MCQELVQNQFQVEAVQPRSGVPLRDRRDGSIPPQRSFRALQVLGPNLDPLEGIGEAVGSL